MAIIRLLDDPKRYVKLRKSSCSHTYSQTKMNKLKILLTEKKTKKILCSLLKFVETIVRGGGGYCNNLLVYFGFVFISQIKTIIKNTQALKTIIITLFARPLRFRSVRTDHHKALIIRYTYARAQTRVIQTYIVHNERLVEGDSGTWVSERPGAYLIRFFFK